ncbi:MAG: polyamine ABC transporter substrate-binding protein [Gaiella sp.]
MTWHPRERYGRREFLGLTALGALTLSGAGGLLTACGGSGNGGGQAVELQLARPDNPVTLPLYDDNPAIASGLEPEGGPLRIYNWTDYIDKATVKKWAKELGVDFEVTTFPTMDEAIAKISSGAADFDLFFPTTDRLERMVLAKQVQPLNKDYIPNLSKTIWPALQDPFYDQGSQYTVPYVTWSTGIGYRVDKIAKRPEEYDNPYDIYFDSANKGKTWLLDDSREAPAAMLLRAGITDLNTENPKDIEIAKKQLLELIDAVNIKVSTEDYSKLPEGSAYVHQAWSGSMIAAPYYLPKGTDADVLAYWYPGAGKGPIGSDTMAVLKGAKNPVLAHLLIDYLLSEEGSLSNFGYVGYQPPLTALDPDSLVDQEYVPPNLASAIVREEDFVGGLQELELSPDGQKLWQNAWAEFKAGI